MLLTSWLSLLRSDDPFAPRMGASRRTAHTDPWRHAQTAFRGNPFVPPDRIKAEVGKRLRRSERRWVTPQRLP
jgi:hypothetical protein